jgi:hypothetical protein
VTLSRRQVLAGLGAVATTAALGTGVTVASLRDGEPLPPTVVASGDVAYVDCETGDRPAFAPLSLALDGPDFADTASVGPFGVETVPAWLAVRVCPPTETVAGTPVADYLGDSTVSVTGAAPVPLGTVVVVPVDPAESGRGRCGDRIAVAVSAVLDTVGLDADGLADDASGLELDFALQTYLVQRTGVTDAEARAAFTDRFGACGEAVSSPSDPDDEPPAEQGPSGPPGRDPNGPPGRPGGRR